jgi:hypothetical protein
VRADDWHWDDVWNFHLEGTKTALELVALSEGARSPRDIPIELLRDGPLDAWPAMFLSPFLGCVRQGIVVRRGGVLGYGVPPYETRWLSSSDAAMTLRAADRELLLESVRREVAPNAASRLSCVWASEDTLAGRNWIRSMFSEPLFIVPVEVRHPVRWTRCDARWLESLEASDEQAVESYWEGVSTDEPLWEYLIEGQIACTDEDDLERIRAFVQEKGPPPDLLGPPDRR